MPWKRFVLSICPGGWGRLLWDVVGENENRFHFFFPLYLIITFYTSSPGFMTFSPFPKWAFFFLLHFFLFLVFHLYQSSNHCGCSLGFCGPRIIQLSFIILGNCFLIPHLFKLFFSIVYVLNQISPSVT